MSDEYHALRARFVDLCLFGVPERLREERRREAPSEFDHFCADPRLDGVAVQAPNLWFGTKRLAAEAPYAQFHWVGSFAVHINVQTKMIACVGDEKRQVNGFPAWHPHVRVENNQACFGGGVQKLTYWFGDGKPAHIALYVLEFLCLARGTSHYADPNLWEALTNEEVVAWKKLRP